MNKRNKTYIIAISALMVALSYVIPAFMPTIDVILTTVTPFSHLPIMISIFISPYVTIMSCIGTTLAFLVRPAAVPFHVPLRALSHIVFAIPASFAIRKGLGVKGISIILFAVAVNLVHALAEVITVLTYWWVVNPDNIALSTILLTVGLITLLHGLFDYFAAIAVYEAGARAKLLKPRFIWSKNKAF